MRIQFKDKQFIAALVSLAKANDMNVTHYLIHLINKEIARNASSRERI